jgi:nicotinamide-nucleotide amidase
MQTIKASIITIGDELLIGQVIDTNSAWIAQQLNKIGIWVHKRVAVGDVYDEVWKVLDEEANSSELILITGGLGPPADDFSIAVLWYYFGGKIIMN